MVTARDMVRKAGKIVGILLRPHDLRRFAATYASRRGTPIEIVSKIILRHANLSTTQRYLGKVNNYMLIRKKVNTTVRRLVGFKFVSFLKPGVGLKHR